MIGAFNPGIWRVVREGRFDVVVCYGYRSATQWIAAMATRSAGSKLVWTTDATTLRSRPGTVGQSWKPILKRVVLPVLFRSGDAVFAPSTKTADFVRTIGVEANRVFVTPFVVDNDFFERGARDADPAALRGAWGVPQEAFVALFSGKLVRWKRPVDMLDAATRVPGLFAVFAGDGELRSVLERRARVLGVTDRVRMLGFVNQTHLPATYRAADVLVLPSEFEPFGVVVNEAFASGTPAIATTLCGASGDLVRDNETGFTYACGDVAALASHLRRLASDPELRDRCARGARLRISKWGPADNAEAFAAAVIRITGERA